MCLKTKTLKVTGQGLASVCVWTYPGPAARDGRHRPGSVRARRAISAGLAVCWPSRENWIASCSRTWLRKWPERGHVEGRQATNPAGRGLGLTTLKNATTADAGSSSKRILPTPKWAARGGEMDVPWPNCDSADALKVSLA